MQEKPLKVVVLALIGALLTACGGGGSHHSTSNTNNSGNVQGVATPSNVSVITAQNANAGS